MRDPLMWAVARGCPVIYLTDNFKMLLLVSVLDAESCRMRTVATVALQKKHSSFLIGSFCAVLRGRES